MIAYHGTPFPARVLAEGLRADLADNSPCVWLALRPEDAAPFGTVLAVDLDGLPGSWPLEDGEPSWQAHFDADIGPERICGLSEQAT